MKLFICARFERFSSSVQMNGLGDESHRVRKSGSIERCTNLLFLLFSWYLWTIRKITPAISCNGSSKGDATLFLLLFCEDHNTLVMCRGRVSYDGPHIIGGPTLSANAQPALSTFTPLVNVDIYQRMLCFQNYKPCLIPTVARAQYRLLRIWLQ